MLKILHTGDWHLGHALAEHDRSWEQQRFLDWLVDTLVDQGAHALIVAGDLFDTANPSARAMGQWYDFVSECRQRCPGLQVVLIAGNHDSAGRLQAPAALLDRLGVRVVGSLPRDAVGRLVPEGVVLPLRGDSGQVEALVAAVPFLRPADLPGARELALDEPTLADGVRWVYAKVFEAARQQLQDGQALLATGHCYMVGTQLSELSERRILGGNLNALPVDLFPEDVAYVALGHLHRAQRVGGRDTVRYAGSPMPLSFQERAYRHQVAVVTVDGPGPASVSSLPVPRAVPLLSIPEQGAASLDEVVEALAQLPEAEGPRDRWPWLHLAVHLDPPTPLVLPRIQTALEGRGVRLVDVAVTRAGEGGALADHVPITDLSSLDPQTVFTQRCHKDGLDPVPDDLLVAFAELLEAAEHYDQEG